MTNPKSPLALAREYAELRYDIAQPELTVYEFDDASLTKFAAALKEQYGQSDMFAAYRLKVAEECCERLMSACTDAGCPDDVNMADWIRSIAAPPVAQPVGDAAIKACALMIKGICITRPQDAWVADIEKRIRFMIDGSNTVNKDNRADASNPDLEEIRDALKGEWRPLFPKLSMPTDEQDAASDAGGKDE